MGINISNISFLSQKGETTENSTPNRQLQVKIPSGVSAKEAGILLLQNMNKGDVFSGEITNITRNQITMMLPNGANVSAMLADALSYNIGDTASFTVKDNSGEQIILKSLGSENVKNLMNDQTITSALKNAGLAINDTTVSLVHNMMKYGLCLDGETINSYARNLSLAQNATAQDVVLMTKLGIPITDENVSALHDYYDFNEGLSVRTNELSSNVFDILGELSMEGQGSIADFLSEFTGAFGNTLSEAESLSAFFSDEQLEKLSSDIKDLEPVIEELNENSPELGQSEISAIAQKVKDGNLTAKELLTDLSQLFNNEIVDSSKLKNLMKNPDIKSVIENFMRQEMYIKPEDFNNENLKKTMAKILNDTNELSTRLSNTPKMESFVSNMNGLSNDIEFMNTLNGFMPYIQIPLKMSGQNAHGDLYVYKNGKNSTEGKEELKAFLHLDMDNLGALDILVKLREKNVTTDFKVESEEILDYIEAHMDELNAALMKKGYNATTTAEIQPKDEKGHPHSTYDFQKTVLEDQVPSREIKRFSFDVRA